MAQDFWTPERIEILQKIRAAGGSQREAALSLGVSRSAIAGKWHRLGAVVPLLPKRLAHKAVPPAPIKPVPLKPNTRPVPLVKLRGPHCRAVLDGKGRDGLALFCGARQARGSSWCPFHRNLYLQPPNQREQHGEARQQQQRV